MTIPVIDPLIQYLLHSRYDQRTLLELNKLSNMILDHNKV